MINTEQHVLGGSRTMLGPRGSWKTLASGYKLSHWARNKQPWNPWPLVVVSENKHPQLASVIHTGHNTNSCSEKDNDELFSDRNTSVFESHLQSIYENNYVQYKVQILQNAMQFIWQCSPPVNKFLKCIYVIISVAGYWQERLIVHFIKPKC